MTETRPPVPIDATVYDAFPSLATLHSVVREHYPDMRETFFWDVFERNKPYTCLSVERFYNIFKSIEYIAKANVPGDIVECGVFLGGSIVGAAEIADHFGLTERLFYIFDTFEGFPANTFEKDLGGVDTDLSTLHLFNNNFRHIVERNIERSGLSPDRFVLVPGLVEDTLREPQRLGPVAYLRLDTDYFTSTTIELEALYPKLSQGGVLIVDDYGHFEGVRAAVDAFFERSSQRPLLLQRVDYTGPSGVKA
jgi:hypothetical protein